MRIVYLNVSGHLGGAETSLLEMLRALRMLHPSWDLTVITGSEGPLLPQLRALGVSAYALPLPPALAVLGEGSVTPAAMFAAAQALPRYLFQLRSLLREAAPCLIHAAGLKLQILAAWAKPSKVPLIWHMHDYAGSRRFMGRLVSLHAHRCGLAIANSMSVAADLQALCPDLPIKVLHNAVDLTRFHPTGPTLDLDRICQLPPAPSNTCRIGLVATFAHWKGHKVFLDALMRIPEALPVRAYIIGAPIYQTGGSQYSIEDLKVQAHVRGLRDRIGFTGFLEDTPSALRSLDIVVHASTRPEPFGMVLIEAMACGKPVVAALAGGAAEIIRDGEDGLGHVPGDARGLACQIARLAMDSQLRAEIGQRARCSAIERFSSSRMAERLTAIYQPFSIAPSPLRTTLEAASEV